MDGAPSDLVANTMRFSCPTTCNLACASGRNGISLWFCNLRMMTCVLVTEGQDMGAYMYGYVLHLLTASQLQPLTTPRRFYNHLSVSRRVRCASTCTHTQSFSQGICTPIARLRLAGHSRAIPHFQIPRRIADVGYSADTPVHHHPSTIAHIFPFCHSARMSCIHSPSSAFPAQSISVPAKLLSTICYMRQCLSQLTVSLKSSNN